MGTLKMHPAGSSAGGLEEPQGGREAGASEGRDYEVTSEKPWVLRRWSDPHVCIHSGLTKF